MDEAVAAEVAAAFRGVARLFGNAEARVFQRSVWVESGAGEFSDHLIDGVARVQVGWRRVLSTSQTAAVLIAKNTNAVKVNLDLTDADLAPRIDLGAPPRLPAIADGPVAV
jgi:hypothetical protein